MEEKRLIKFEMRRAFGKTFFIAYLIGFLSGCGGLISYWIQVRWTPVESISCFDAWLYCYSVAESSAYKVIFPLVICLPYLTTIYTDRKSGMIFNIVSRMSYSQYLISKLAVGIVETIIMSASVLMSWFVISISLFPLNIPDTDLNVFVTGAFSEFYTEAPLKYESGINCVHSILREQHKNGVTILIASHDKADIKSLCQHVFYLEEGRLVKTD